MNNNTASGTVTVVVNVPQNAALGNTRIRVIGAGGGVGGNPPYNQNITGPCMSGVLEAEDYGLTITQGVNTGCGPVNAGSISPSSIPAVCEGGGISLNVTGSTAGINGIIGKWQQRTPAGSGSWADVPNANATSLTQTGLTESTDYRFVVVCENNNETDTSGMVTANVRKLPAVNGIISTWLSNGTYEFRADNPQNVSDYLWSFGDGSSSTDSVATHHYNRDGDFTVSLTVSNDCGSNSASTVVSYALGVDRLSAGLGSYTLFPNPAKEQVTLMAEGLQNHIQKLEVFNVLGQKVWEVDLNKAVEYQLSVGNFANGLYQIRVWNQAGQIASMKLEVWR